MAETKQFDWNKFILIFLFCSFVIVMAIGGINIFIYNANAPEPTSGGGGHGMLLPQDGEYAPHVQWPTFS